MSDINQPDVFRQPRPPLYVALLVLATFFLFNPEIIADWRIYSFDDGTYSHAYLMPFVILFLVWRAWAQQQLQLRWNPVFFTLFIASLLVFLWLTVAQQSLLSRLMLPIPLAFALASLFTVNASLLVPVSLLWFITPIWGLLNDALQSLSVAAVTKIMSWTHIPTYVEGNFVHIPSGSFEIAGGCSGLRYFIVAVALSIIFCFMNFTKKSSMLVFMGAAMAGAIVTNWIRIALIIYIGDYSNMQSSIVYDHNMFGWYIFIPFIVLLFYFGSKLEPLPAPPAPLPPYMKAVPVKAISTVAIALIVLSGVGIHWQKTNTLRWLIPTVDVETAVAASKAVEGITPAVFAWTDVTFEQQKTDNQIIYRQHYYFTGETDAHKVDFFLNNVVPDGWTVTDTEHQADATLLQISNSAGEQALVYYSYLVGEHKTGNRQQLRINRLLAALTLQQDTELYWQFLHCSTPNCAAQKQLFTQAGLTGQ